MSAKKSRSLRRGERGEGFFAITWLSKGGGGNAEPEEVSKVREGGVRGNICVRGLFKHPAACQGSSGGEKHPPSCVAKQ